MGSGGTSKTVRAVAESQGAASVQLVSRGGGLDSAGQPMLDYQQAAAVKTTQVIINTTPRGMYPHNQEQPLFKLADFPELEAVADVIYNPLYSNLVLQARELGLKACGGLEMLVAQA
ncbi:MAG: shikimate 5-dehydrogenase, partial [Firmicutes bacterium]|nr:shikimate 5-dehydrogenase [Bacillota bacterium]